MKEHTRIFGRSILSSEYGVSPETIRRSLRLLADMGIVEIRQNSGGIILSQEKAKQYILRFNEYMDIRGLQRKLRELMSEQEKTSREILSIATPSCIPTKNSISTTCFRPMKPSYPQVPR